MLLEQAKAASDNITRNCHVDKIYTDGSVQ